MKTLAALFIIIRMLVYPACGIVTEVNVEDNYIIIEDPVGNLWQYDSVEDWQVGDVASMTMYTNETDAIYDDVIIDIRYMGRYE